MTSDQLRLPLRGAGSPLRISGDAAAAVFGVGAAALLGIVAALHPELWRALLAAALSVNLIVVAMKWPRAAAAITLMWLPFVGLTRRLLTAESAWTQNDPLLLVGPIAALFLCYRIFIVEQRRVAPDLISKLVVLLLIFAVIGAFNPFGTTSGGVMGGLAGCIYLGVPLLWFLIGREIADRQMVRRLIYAVIVVSLPLAAYGLYQTEFGSFPQWDVDWYFETGNSALRIGTTETGNATLRPWSSFPSNSEYSAYLGIAIAFVIALAYHRRFVPAITIPPLLVAVFLAGGRAVMALTLLSTMVLTALRTRNKLLALGVVVLGIALTYGAALTFGNRLDQAAGRSGNTAADRQVGGLLNPLDPDKSTFLTHWDAIQRGVSSGFSNPVGQGTGASNIGARAGGGGDIESDNDLADVFVSWGFIGGFTFVAIILLCFKTVFGRYLRGPPDALLLAVAGIMVVTFGQWLNGGHYATAALVWFLLGWAVRPRPKEEADDDKTAGRREPPVWQRWRALRRRETAPSLAR